jgi:hypothetical protein
MSDRSYRDTQVEREMDRRQTRPATYISWIAVLFVIGLALVVFGIIRFSHSNEAINATPGAVAPSEGLLPGQSGNGADVQGDNAPAQTTGPAPASEAPGAIDVPGSDGSQQ